MPVNDAITGAHPVKINRIQHHRVTLNGAQPVMGISSISKEQTDILPVPTIKKRTLYIQLTLLKWSV